MSAQSDAEWAEDDARYRDQIIGRLILECELMLQELHECAIAEDRVRARHRKTTVPVWTGDDPVCGFCSKKFSPPVPYPCPTLLDMIGLQPEREGR